MPKNVTQYDLLISCPGDITDEVNIIEEVVENFNQQFSKSLEVLIQTRHWSKSSYPQSGGKPQELLNEQFVKDCDAAVAIFWTRFGTPTDEYKSGSEEEIQIMLDSGKQVFLYFCEKPVKPGYNSEQYKLVEEFKEKYKDKGIYRTYDSNESFKELFNAHLTKYFLTVKTVENIKSETKPRLSVKSICENEKISDTFFIQKYLVPNPMSEEKRLQRIKNKIDYVNSIHFAKKEKTVPTAADLKPTITTVASFDFLTGSRVTIDDTTKSSILVFSNKNNFSLCNDFFDLGELREDMTAQIISSMHGGGRVLKGKENEKQKYNYIYAIKDEIKDYLLWKNLEETYKDLFITKLILVNTGSNFDEDIDIEIIIPKEMFIPHSEIPTPNYFTIEEFDKDYDFSDIFTIKQTEKYFDYDSSVKKRRFTPIPVEPVFKNNELWYIKKYKSELNKLFCYEIFFDSANYIIKLHIDYIKQHTSIAFPTPLFVNKTSLAKEITYRIISKNNPDIVNGTLKVNLSIEKS